MLAIRDAYQIIKGGIRLAAVAAPTERDTGWNTDRDSAGAQGGTWIPFDGTTSRELYSTRAQYVREVTNQNVRDGFLVRDHSGFAADSSRPAAVHKLVACPGRSSLPSYR
ncbi:alpha/beta hydrolase domain-containing protein [Amycolatopsis sp. MEPSY49]|uniref:alpha/beta hydrolase domain-containing protein n=1 Tax=Amycolatopsis sp. MEPSY49 TaxID=3151600 RepID=UPI003F519CE2